MVLVIPLLTLNKEMPIGISAFTVKNNAVFLKQSTYNNKIWLQLSILVFLSREQQKHTDGTPPKNSGSEYDNER